MNFVELCWAAFLVVQWIFLSSCIILFNKYLLAGTFPHPCTLVGMHMAFSVVCAMLWNAMGWVDVPPMKMAQWGGAILPVGLCFAGSLVASNTAYLYISVAFIQMIKASTPVVVLIFSFIFGLESPNVQLIGYILLITFGVTTSCVAQISFSYIGVTLQLAALVCEAMRLCLVNILLVNKGVKLSSIASLYYIAPTCLLCLLLPWAHLEAPVVLADLGVFARTGYLTLLANSSVAFALNIATMALIKHTSALTLNVAGVFKDLLLILWSVAVSGAIVTPVQYLGYAIAFSGVTGYTAYKRAEQNKAAENAVRAASDAASQDDDRASESRALLERGSDRSTTPPNRNSCNRA